MPALVEYSVTPDEHPQPAEVYARREAAETSLASALDRQSWWLGTANVVLVAAGAVVVLILGFDLLWVSLAAALFVSLAVVQARVLRRRDWHRRLIDINRRELRALRREASFSVRLTSPVDSTHCYADDLEIFSERGLFDYASRCLTTMGRRTFAAWLSAAAAPDEILARQTAARELAPAIDHRHTLAAHGLAGETVERQVRVQKLLADLDAGQWAIAIPSVVLFALPALTLAAGALGWSSASFRSLFWGLVAVQLALNFRFARRVGRLLREAAGCARVLEGYAAALKEIAAHTCESPRLRELQARLRAHGATAPEALTRLSAVLQWMEVRNAGMLHGILNSLLLWDLHGARRLATWQQRFRTLIPAWLDTVGEWEALSSLAAVAFNGTGWVWPIVRADGFGLLAEDLGHPLLPEGERVASGVQLDGRGTIWIVTGPNMAGKSTFLRTVGVSLVLAQAGAPVCARRFEVSPLQLITSMRISDSLDKRLSLFYAELQRLKQVLDAVERREPVFFLIDEMLKGTNTLDRQAGALALVRQLQRDGASGIVATHDLALARLADERPGSIVNYHFDGTVDGDQLIFDYRLRAGACEHFNALSLMRAIGIRLDERM